MPHIDAFKNAEGYYGTLLNEIMHWTRHPSRLDRSFDKDKYGMNTHAMEQLVAEIGTSMLAARLGTVPMLNKDSIGSIDSFIKLLKDDKRAVFKAAALALNPRPERGQFSSLQTGLRAAIRPNHAVFFHPVDVPGIRLGTVARLCAAWGQAPPGT